MPVTEIEQLDDDLLAAHNRGELVGLYTRAANLAQADGQIDAMCFYLTHAYVFALETGDATAKILHSRLRAQGREE